MKFTYPLQEVSLLPGYCLTYLLMIFPPFSVVVGHAWFTSDLTGCYKSIKNWFHFGLCKLLFGLLQGHVFSPLLFAMDSTPLGLVIGKHAGSKFHFYTNDTSTPSFMCICLRRMPSLSSNS